MSEITRRQTLRYLAVAGATAGPTGRLLGEPQPKPAATRPARQPNIVFILVDDMRWDAMSCLGHPFVRTPNIDRLASQGARFANAFVTTSLCSPSRASFLTGTYAHTHGVRINAAIDPDPTLPTFPQLLRRAGYETAFVGKWHMQPKPDPRPGFDYWLSFTGQGKYVDPELNENGRNFQAKGYMTDLLTEYAMRWLRRPRRKPFCLYLSHKAVHGPFTPAPRHKKLYADAKLPEPASFRDTLADKPAWMRAAIVRGQRREEIRRNKDKPVPPAVPPTPWKPHHGPWLDYFRTLAAVDESVGRILQTLDELGLGDETIVIFTSDNGYFHGEHRRGDKRLAYEESIRIPLLVRYPPQVRAGLVPEPMVLNIDIAPTLLDFAAVPIPPVMQGASFRPLLRGEPVPWRTSFLYEYFQEAWLPGIPTMLAVRTERWKFVTYPDIDDLDELYDLANDPHELRNLAQDPKHAATLAAMRKELARLLRATGYDKPRPLPPVRRVGSVVLEYDFEGSGQTVTDRSGKGNHGTIHGARRVPGRIGMAMRFDGRSFVEVPKGPALDPSGKPWTVEAWIKPEADDGVVLARGGQSHGYSLYLAGGVPCFAVRAAGGLEIVAAEGKIRRAWTHVAGMLTGDRQLQIYVNGTLAGTRRVGMFIPADPNEPMQIGRDTGTHVGDYDVAEGFRGLIDEVRIYDGQIDPGRIRSRSQRAAQP